LAIAGVLEACWEDFDGRKLTAQEGHETGFVQYAPMLLL
jgi:hypothetical protein